MGKTFIIAEAGVNHNGDINIAKQLIDLAALAKVDAIKFQTFKTENLIKRDAQKANYQKRTTNSKESQFEMLKRLELSDDSHFELMNYAKGKGLKFISSPFDHESIRFLHKLGVEVFKIPSGEITNYKYLDYIGSFNKKIILSTGMSYMTEVEDAFNVLTAAGTAKEKITILHANTEYPTPFKDVNLRAMQTIADKLNVDIGYSDHTPGIEVSIAAVALGAKVIEKHFTIDRNMEGPDHKASIEPNELVRLVETIRNIEIALGSQEKFPSESELQNITAARKSLVAKINILKGDYFSEDNVTAKRPGNGINPMKWNEIMGQKAKKDYKESDQI